MVYEIAQAQNKLACAFLQIGKHDDALGYYQKALATLLGLENVRFCGQTLEKIKGLKKK